MSELLIHDLFLGARPVREDCCRNILVASVVRSVILGLFMMWSSECVWDNWQCLVRGSKNHLLIEVLRGSSCMHSQKGSLLYLYLFLQQKRLFKALVVLHFGLSLGEELEYLAVGLKWLWGNSLEIFCFSFSGRSSCFCSCDFLF